MKLPPEVRERFRRYGRSGGRLRAARMTSRARSAVARRAAVVRWTRTRFGTADFASLGIPGGELIDAGLADLAEGKATREALAISLAAPRLRREGVPVTICEPEPERRLYDLLAQTEGDLAHARYGAYLRRLVSFANACRLVRIDRDCGAT